MRCIILGGRQRERERESKGEVTKNIPLTEDLFSTSQPSLYHIVLSPLKTSIKETYKNSIHLLLRASKHNQGSILSTVLNKFIAPPTLNPYLTIPLFFVFLSENKTVLGSSGVSWQCSQTIQMYVFLYQFNIYVLGQVFMSINISNYEDLFQTLLAM